MQLVTHSAPAAPVGGVVAVLSAVSAVLASVCHILASVLVATLMTCILAILRTVSLVLGQVPAVFQEVCSAAGVGLRTLLSSGHAGPLVHLHRAFLLDNPFGLRISTTQSAGSRCQVKVDSERSGRRSRWIHPRSCQRQNPQRYSRRHRLTSVR